MRFARLVLAVLMWGGLLSCAADMPVAPELVGKGTVNGIVLDRDGTPLDEVRVTFLQTPPRQPVPYFDALTKSDGTFALELEAGAYDVRLWPHTHPGLPQARTPFTVKAGENRFEYRYAGVLVSGTAVGPGGVSIPYPYVSAYSQELQVSASTTGQNGSYQLLLTPGQYWFMAHPGSYPQRLPVFEFEVTIPSQDTTINLDFSGHELAIHASLFGTPLPGAGIVAQRPGVYTSAVTDAQGEAVIYLPTGSYDFLVAGISGITGPERRAIDVQSSGPIDFALGGVRWETTVRRSGDQSPVALAEVSVREIGADREGHATTDQTGTFQMIARPDVLHDVWVRPYGSNVSYLANGVSSTADSTFDLLVGIPAP